MGTHRYSNAKAILFMGLLLITMVSYTIYAWAIGLLLLGLYLQIERIHLKKKVFIETIVLFLLLLLAIIRFQLFLVEDALPLYANAFWGNLSGFVLCIITWFCLRTLMVSDHKEKVIEFSVPLLWIHVSAFFVQFVVFVSWGYFLDFVKPITGEDSRFGSFLSNYVGGIGSLRPTGLTVEPSTYFYVVLALTILILIHNRFPKHRVILILAILSMYFSFSTAAIIIATLLLIYLLFTLRLKPHYYVLILVTGIVIAYWGGASLMNLYLGQQAKFDQTSGIRENLIEIVANRNTEDALLAFGPFAVDKKITYVSQSIREGGIIASFNDSGIFVFLWLEFGYLGIAIFLFLCKWQYKYGKERLILFLILSLSKINPFSPFFIMYFVVSVTPKLSIIVPFNGKKIDQPLSVLPTHNG